MISIKKFTFNPFQENTYVLYDETKECIIIDPGCYEPTEEGELTTFISEHYLTPVKIVSTHSHIDHVLGNKFVKDRYEIEIYVHPLDLQTFELGLSSAMMYGISRYQPNEIPNHFLEEGDLVTFGNSTLDVLFVPGHAPGHIVLVGKEEKFVINGDCLFYGSIGRTDLPGGDHQTLLTNIKTKLFTLPDDYTVYCGHGPETTIGFEKLNNPFLT